MEGGEGVGIISMSLPKRLVGSNEISTSSSTTSVISVDGELPRGRLRESSPCSSESENSLEGSVSRSSSSD